MRDHPTIFRRDLGLVRETCTHLWTPRGIDSIASATAASLTTSRVSPLKIDQARA
jgi:hypothetical protein